MAAATHWCVSVCVNRWISRHFKVIWGTGKVLESTIQAQCIYLLPLSHFHCLSIRIQRVRVGEGVVFLCEQGPVLFQLPQEQGGVLKGEKINLPIFRVLLCVSIWDGGLPNVRAARAAYASLDVDIPRSICHLSVKKTQPSVFTAKREPRLRSHSLPSSSPPGVHEVFYKSWLRRSRLRLPLGVPLPVRARAHASFRMGLESFRALAAPDTACLHTPSVHQPRWLSTWAFTCAPIHYHTFDFIYSPWIKYGLHCICCRDPNTNVVVSTMCPLALYWRNKQTVLLCLFFLFDFGF